MSERVAGGGPGVVAVAGEALVDFVPAGADDVFRAAPGRGPEHSRPAGRHEVHQRLPGHRHHPLAHPRSSVSPAGNSYRITRRG